MEISKVYNPSDAESKWYKHWLEKGYFHSEPDDRESYTVVIPPPNVTGVLHMGHMLNNTIQDVLVRRARMLGKNACWIPGTDHASIATEAKVVNKLRAEGIKKSDLSRDEFMKHAWEWKEKHGGIILNQLKKLGASCDWERTNFTMDEAYSKSVIDVFIDLFNKGKIYRGVRMINWDPEAKTALSDEEVIYKEVNSKLFHVRYKIAGTDDEWLVIATTRPETILGDSAICINPNDARYLNLHGKKAIVPISNRQVPIILDEYVDMDFGTGCLKVTPAHDQNDYELGKKHNLETIDILNDNATLNDKALHYTGLDRFEVRKKIEKELNDLGYLLKVEDHINKVGFSERTDVIIEPRLSPQWFVSMGDLAKPALENVMNGQIKFYPDNMKNTYRHWMENIKDWCISRQLWWGHRIPAWYYGNGSEDFVVAKDQSEALIAINKKTNLGLKEDEIWQDEDVLDTWFSSWLWPISVFNGLTEQGNNQISYYYPTCDLVTAPEIMFFWVARMIIAGYEYMGNMPFKNVYYTGIVRDKLGRKMSKSLGNSPDPLELIDKYGADGVRVGMLLSSPAGNDLPFDSSQCEQGRNFTNKLWNAFRLINSWEVAPIEQTESNKQAILWFEHKFNAQLNFINDQYDKFRISDALMATYKLVWDDFCSWFLETVKPGFEQPIDEKTKSSVISFFEDLLVIVHPFTPFITEELWHQVKRRPEGDDIIIRQWPATKLVDQQILSDFVIVQEIISQLRSIRKELNIANKVKLDLILAGESNLLNAHLNSVIIKLGNLQSMKNSEDKIINAHSFMVRNMEFFIPLGDELDMDSQISKIREELDYTRGFLKSVQHKLSNKKFVNNAPEKVVEIEKKKESDALEKIAILTKKMEQFQ